MARNRSLEHTIGVWLWRAAIGGALFMAYNSVARADSRPLKHGRPAAKTADNQRAKRIGMPETVRLVSARAAAAPVEALLKKAEQPEAIAGFTGLIVDARGMGLSRSMSPRLRRMDGSDVWTGGGASAEFVIDEGIVAYVRSLEEARNHARAGANPLVIRAVQRHETPFPSDPRLSDDVADSLLKCAERDGFLKKFKVVFIID
jgi:hypothetical protein